MKGETVKLLYSHYGNQKITFCISLVRAFNVRDAKHDSVSELELEVLPKPKAGSQQGRILTYNLQLSGTHDDLAQSVVEHFQQNHHNDSVVCEENTPRECKESCQSYGEKQCKPGCAFDYNTLGSCRDWPYGYSSQHSQQNIINPCFFFYFKPQTFWKPEKYWHDEKNSGLPETEDKLQITCDAKILFKEEPDLYTQLLGISSELLADGQLDSHVKRALQKFMMDKRLFEELKSLEEYEIDELNEAYRDFDSYKLDIEVYKLQHKFDGGIAHIQENYLKDVLDEFLYEMNNIGYYVDSAKQKLGCLLRWRKYFNMLPQTKQELVWGNLKTFVKSIEKILDENYDYHTVDKQMRKAVCSEKDDHCRLQEQISTFIHSSYARSDDDIIWRRVGKFLDALALVDILDNGDIETTNSEIIEQIKKEEAWTSYKHGYNSLILFSDNQKASKFKKYSKDHLLHGYVYLKNQISIAKDKKERIEVTFYPQTQTIPNKFFPMTGDEEAPYVAIKLNFEDKEG